MKTDRRSFVAACLAFLGLGRLAPNKQGSILQAARQTGKTATIVLLYEERMREIEAQHQDRLKAFNETLALDYVQPMRIVSPTV